MRQRETETTVSRAAMSSAAPSANASPGSKSRLADAIRVLEHTPVDDLVDDVHTTQILREVNARIESAKNDRVNHIGEGVVRQRRLSAQSREAQLNNLTDAMPSDSRSFKSKWAKRIGGLLSPRPKSSVVPANDPVPAKEPVRAAALLAGRAEAKADQPQNDTSMWASMCCRRRPKPKRAKPARRNSFANLIHSRLSAVQRKAVQQAFKMIDFSDEGKLGTTELRGVRAGVRPCRP